MIETYVPKIIVEERIVLHRLPYMKMDPNIIWWVNIFMFLVVVMFTWNNEALGDIIKIYASFMGAFNIFIYPGFFYYAANKERL